VFQEWYQAKYFVNIGLRRRVIRNFSSLIIATLVQERAAFPNTQPDQPNTAAEAVVQQQLERTLKIKQMSYLIMAIGTLLLCIPDAPADAQSGIASVYSTESGSRTASGARLNPGALTAAHRTLPLGSHVRVTNRSNGRSVVLTINDRGPFVRGRIIDVTPAAARTLGFSGLASVSVERE
jgi:rare lipoprotein A